MRAWVALALALALPAILASTGSAGTGLRSTRVALTTDAWTEVDLEREGIRVVSYRVSFTRGAQAVGPGPAMSLNLKNSGSVGADVSVAVALIDREGNLVGAATASHPGKLEAGKAGEMKVVFRDVNASLATAAWLHLSIETRP